MVTSCYADISIKYVFSGTSQGTLQASHNIIITNYFFHIYPLQISYIIVNKCTSLYILIWQDITWLIIGFFFNIASYLHIMNGSQLWIWIWITSEAITGTKTLRAVAQERAREKPLVCYADVDWYVCLHIIGAAWNNEQSFKTNQFN